MNARLISVLALCTCGLASVAHAADAKASRAEGASTSAAASAKSEESRSAASKEAAETDSSRSHGGQFHVRVDVGAGYNMAFRYDSSPRCAAYDRSRSPADQQKFCGFGAPPTIGVALGFAPVGFFEPFVFGRFGLGDTAAQTNMGKPLLFGAGIRLYTMSDSPFKIFFSPWLGLDFTPGPVDPDAPGEDAMQLNSGSYRTDILVGLQVGPQYDFSKMFGVYATGGLSFGMLRYFSGVADFSVGVQARLP